MRAMLETLGEITKHDESLSNCYITLLFYSSNLNN